MIILLHELALWRKEENAEVKCGHTVTQAEVLSVMLSWAQFLAWLLPPRPCFLEGKGQQTLFVHKYCDFTTLWTKIQLTMPHVLGIVLVSWNRLLVMITERKAVSATSHSKGWQTSHVINCNKPEVVKQSFMGLQWLIRRGLVFTWG